MRVMIVDDEPLARERLPGRRAAVAQLELLRRASLNAVRKPDGTATVALRIPFMPLELRGAVVSRAV